MCKSVTTNEDQLDVPTEDRYGFEEVFQVDIQSIGAVGKQQDA